MHMNVKHDGDVSDFYFEKQLANAAQLRVTVFAFFIARISSSTELVLKYNIRLQIFIISNAENAYK